MARSNLSDPICVGIGICPLDYIFIVEKFPQPDDKIDSLYFSRQGGGPVPNALSTLGRFGIPCAFVGKCGRDNDGSTVEEELKLFNVDTSHLILDPESRTPRSFIIVDQSSGKRTVILDRSQSAAMAPDEIDTKLIQSADFLLLDGRDQEAAITAAIIARKSDVQVILDAGSARTGINEILPHIDHLVCSHRFAEQFTQESDPGKAVLKLAWIGFKSVVITYGSKGSIAATPDGQLFEQEAVKAEVIDSTGAGDIFHGAFIFGLAQKWELPQIVEFASAAAAIKCARIGGRHGIPDLNDVYNLLNLQ